MSDKIFGEIGCKVNKTINTHVSQVSFTIEHASILESHTTALTELDSFEDGTTSAPACAQCAAAKGTKGTTWRTTRGTAWCAWRAGNATDTREAREAPVLADTVLTDGN